MKNATGQIKPKNMRVYQQISAPTFRKKTNGLHKTNGKLILPEEKTAQARALVPDIELDTTLDGVRQKVFMDRYSLKDVEGKPVEHHPEEMWQRVAGGIALEKKNPALQKHLASKFYEAIKEF